MAKRKAGKRDHSRRLLDLRGNTWWFKRDIPERCRRAFDGRTALLVNLRTADLRRAKELRDALERETAEAFKATLFDRPAGAGAVSPRDLGATYRALLAAADPHSDGPDDISERALVADAAEAAHDAIRSPEERAAFLDALHGREEVAMHVEGYLAVAAFAPKTRNERRGNIGRLASWASSQRPPLTLDRIDRRAAGRYVSEVIDPMHPATQKKHMAALRGYWTFLEARGHVSVPRGEEKGAGWPWNGQQVRDRGKRIERGAKEDERPFTAKEVQALLHASYPRGMSAAYEAQLRDAIRLSLLSGMRMAEVLTLWVEEVREGPKGAGLVFDIQQGKTEAAARPVPVHPDLTEIVTRRTAGKDGRDWLFHELQGERDPGDTFGKRFARFRKALGVDDKREGKRRSLVNFHSARRWFVTSARHAGIPVATVAAVVGHRPDKRDITFGIYTPGASPAQMRACVEAVTLPGRQEVAEIPGPHRGEEG